MTRPPYQVPIGGEWQGTAPGDYFEMQNPTPASPGFASRHGPQGALPGLNALANPEAMREQADLLVKRCGFCCRVSGGARSPGRFIAPSEIQGAGFGSSQ
jgi:hypothetical protein